MDSTTTTKKEIKHDFPTEIVTLPSKGYFYPEDSPLASGTIEIKYMTAREEDILTSRNLIQKGIVLDKLMESIIVSPINMDELLLGDKNAIMISTRILGYGSKYEFELTDPDTGQKQRDFVDLNSLDTKNIDFDSHTKGVNKFTFELPISKKNIEFKLLTHGDEKEISEELKRLKKFTKVSGIDPDITTRLKKAIISVDGDADRGVVNKFVDGQFLAQDSRAFREHLAEVTPDVDMTYTYTSDFDGEEREATVPMTVEFFWPKTTK
tara:strand:- start:4061 stop:4858 length:798 start_codon:yes stop_codon:yes gene_type:complete